MEEKQEIKQEENNEKKIVKNKRKEPVAADDTPKNTLIKSKKPRKTVKEDKEEPECCPICIDPYTSYVRKKICCPYCSESVCMVCVKKYIISTPQDPHCAHCRKGWTSAFLYENLTRSYIMDEFAKYRSAILWSEQESLLPGDQIRAERILRAKELESSFEISDIRKQMSDKQKELRQLEEKYYSFQNDIMRLRRGDPTITEIRAAGGTLQEKDKREAREFVRRCPHADCTGFLSSAWKCGICSNYTCNQCLEVKGRDRDVEHTCLDDALATAKLLAKDTKPCPKCGIYINKSIGCDLMWCVSCHTPFSWNTLKIVESRNIHNPHYFEFLQRTNGAVPRTPGDMICGGIPQPHIIMSRIISAKNKGIISPMLRTLLHIQDIELRHYHDRMTINQNELRDLRVKYLLKERTKEEIQKYLQIYERRRERAHAVHSILETIVAAGGDIMRQLDTGTNARYDDKLLENITEQMEKLRIYINQELHKVWQLYKCSTPRISKEWTFSHSTSSIIDIEYNVSISSFTNPTPS